MKEDLVIFQRPKNASGKWIGVIGGIDVSGITFGEAKYKVINELEKALIKLREMSDDDDWIDEQEARRIEMERKDETPPNYDENQTEKIVRDLLFEEFPTFPYSSPVCPNCGRNMRWFQIKEHINFRGWFCTCPINAKGPKG